MGLDMYLTAEVFVTRGPEFKFDQALPDDAFSRLVEILAVQDVVDQEGFTGIEVKVPVGYWRKANAIHGWFVTHYAGGEDNCERIPLTREDLERLRDVCSKVLENRALAPDLLPPTEGFFFGSTDIDDWYEADLKNTIGIVDRCLASRFKIFVYQASW